MKQKILLILGGLLLAVIVGEGMLRFGGFVLMAAQESRNRSAFSSAEGYRILCIGESTTLMGGEDSYPSQLEKILNSSPARGKKIKVINKGVPGVTTEYIVSELPKWLEEYRPQLIVAMMGINDYSAWVPLIEQDSSAWSKFIKNSRIYKLLFWIQKSIANRKPGNDGKGDLARTAVPNRQVLKMDVDPVLIEDSHKKSLDLLLFQKNNKELVDLLTERLRRNPLDEYGISYSIKLCKETIAGGELVKKMLTLLIKETPETVPYYDLYVRCPPLPWAESGSQGEISEQVRQLREQFVNHMTLHSYVRLIELTEQKKVPLVVVQYPLRDGKDLERMINTFQRSTPIYFVNNKPSFSKALQESTYDDMFIDRFAGDFGHCTPKGNQLLAGNVAAVIRRQVLEKYF